MKQIMAILIWTILFLSLIGSGVAWAEVISIKYDDTGGDCASIGEWDWDNKICKLTTDVSNTILIDSNSITLDGNGKTITGNGSGNGVLLSGRTDVIIKNLTVKNFEWGIYLVNSSNNTITNNTLHSSTNGIGLSSSNGNTLTNNNVYNNVQGINLDRSNENSLSNNTANSNSTGIYLGNSNNNELKDNSASYNTQQGIYISSSCNNTITNNTIESNTSLGLMVAYSNEWSGCQDTINTITNNTINSNGGCGIEVRSSINSEIYNNMINSNGCGIEVISASEDNKIYNNNFISNTTQAYVYGGENNLFNLDPPIGGNYWSDWTTPDSDGDGFVDNPYVFSGGQDLYPWTTQSGWAYNITGFLPPIREAPNLSVFKSGRTVPAKFQVTDVNGNCVSTLVATFWHDYVNDNENGTQEDGLPPSEASEGNLFRYDPEACQYIFNWKTTGLSAGTYNIYAYDTNLDEWFRHSLHHFFINF